MTLDMNALARLGAQTRLAELAAQMDAIRKAFPDLEAGPAKQRRRRARPSVDAPPVNQAPGDGAARTRKPMSAAAKKAASERMQRYWAGRKASIATPVEKAADTTSGKPTPKRTLSAEARARISAAQKKRWKTQKRKKA